MCPQLRAWHTENIGYIFLTALESTVKNAHSAVGAPGCKFYLPLKHWETSGKSHLAGVTPIKMVERNSSASQGSCEDQMS